jgi:uncharacterized protein (TIGR02722 family)
MYKIYFSLVLIGLMLLAGCSQGTVVTRTEAQTVTDLSGYWNDSDARFVAEQMVTDLLNRPWLPRYVEMNNRNPVVTVGNIRNKTSEHIDSGMFVKNIERELINSGNVKFVAASDERKQLIEERYHQQSHASEDTAKSLAQETGADFMLIGTMTSSIDSSGGKSTRFYQVDMELINIENNEKVWIGQKQIKKEVERSKSGW